MANMFALILAVATLVTGIIWCLDRFKLAPARREKIARLKVETAGAVDDKTLSKAAKQPGWVETCASVFPVLLVVFVVRSFIYEPFQIPSGSMMPTLLIGDFIVVEKYAYGLKDPITQTKLIPTGEPKRGDVVVFKYPLNPQVDYIKRLVGLPGDRITYDPMSKEVTVQPACDNGQACDKALPITYTPNEPSNFVQTFGQSSGSEATSGFYETDPTAPVPQDGVRLIARKENLGGVTHNILIVPGARDQLGAYYQQPGQPLATWVVPAGHYFMMGDNRDNSADSRYWGFVPEKDLVGRASGIWMSFKKQEGEWPTGIRISRIGGIH
ncbi:signal peptidase I [Serratia sp. M24T3]|uniref:Signal peptidase I n=1 Tax=Rouxiella sp. WC2420 TaxID=3234145 RepID=A0AB39VQ47_9GAMM|nr:signal peptidase I [Serratia sp. M24T3]EIC84407.1 signal peptidase I [Serratia sp. M24T3]